MAARINFNECIGCGVCMQICPDVFSLDEEAGKAVFLDGGNESDELIKEAVDSCPVGCINE